MFRHPAWVVSSYTVRVAHQLSELDQQEVLPFFCVTLYVDSQVKCHRMACMRPYEFTIYRVNPSPLYSDIVCNVHVGSLLHALNKSMVILTRRHAPHVWVPDYMPTPKANVGFTY